jgi:hypothetical protein
LDEGKEKGLGGGFNSYAPGTILAGGSDCLYTTAFKNKIPCGFPWPYRISSA